MCFQKLWKMQFYITKHFKSCSTCTSNRDHCDNISVILNIFWEQKYWWQVWFLRGSVSQWPVVYLWTGRANIRSEVLLDLLLEQGSWVNSAQNQLGPNQVGPKPTRPKTKSAQNQLGPKLTRPWITGLSFFSLLLFPLFFFFFHRLYYALGIYFT